MKLFALRLWYIHGMNKMQLSFRIYTPTRMTLNI